jgi:hypothetical protein
MPHLPLLLACLQSSVLPNVPFLASKLRLGSQGIIQVSRRYSSCSNSLRAMHYVGLLCFNLSQNVPNTLPTLPRFKYPKINAFLVIL